MSGDAVKKTVLLVEDGLELLMLMGDLIESLGFDVLSAKSGTDALELLTAETTCDLLLTDIQMPTGISGFQLVDAVRQHRPNLPVIYMSGDPGLPQQVLGAIPAPVLIKPISVEALSDAIHRALGLPHG